MTWVDLFKEVWARCPELGPHELAQVVLDTTPDDMLREALEVTLKSYCTDRYTSRRSHTMPTFPVPAMHSVPGAPVKVRSRLREALMSDPESIWTAQWPDRNGKWKPMRGFTADDCAHQATKLATTAEKYGRMAQKWRELAVAVRKHGGTVGDLPQSVRNRIWYGADAA